MTTCSNIMVQWHLIMAYEFDKAFIYAIQFAIHQKIHCWHIIMLQKLMFVNEANIRHITIMHIVLGNTLQVYSCFVVVGI